MTGPINPNLLLAVPLAPLAGSAIAGLLGTKFFGNVVGRKVSHTATIAGVFIAMVLSIMTLMDVLEHLDDDDAALREMIRLTRPGGLIVITVPALRWLWSDWDVVLHHRRRYHRRPILAAKTGRTPAA